MLSIYLDESVQPASSIFTFAGYAFDKAGVQRFEQQWEDALSNAPENLESQLSRFHMTDFENAKGPFQSWAKTESGISFLRELLTIINETMLFGFSVSLDLKAWRTYAPQRCLHPFHVAAMTRLELRDQERYLAMLMEPHLFVMTCALGLSATLVRHSDDPIPALYVFDPVGPHKGKAIVRHMFDRYICPDKAIQQQFMMDELVWSNAECKKALQAADILAYEAAKEAARVLARTTRPLRKSAQLLFSTGDKKLENRILDGAALSRLEY